MADTRDVSDVRDHKDAIADSNLISWVLFRQLGARNEK